MLLCGRQMTAGSLRARCNTCPPDPANRRLHSHAYTAFTPSLPLGAYGASILTRMAL